MGAIAPPRPGRRSRDLELTVVGVISLVTSIVATAVQTRWVGGWGEATRGAGTLVVLVPPLALWIFGVVLVIMGWRRRPFRGFWDTQMGSDHARRGLLFGAGVLAVVDLVMVVRLGFAVVEVIERGVS